MTDIAESDRRKRTAVFCLFNGERDNIFEDDTVEVTGLSLRKSLFGNTNGGEM